MKRRQLLKHLGASIPAVVFKSEAISLEGFLVKGQLWSP